MAEMSNTTIALAIADFAVSVLRGEFLSDIPEQNRKVIAGCLLTYNAALLYKRDELFSAVMLTLLDELKR